MITLILMLYLTYFFPQVEVKTVIINGCSTVSTAVVAMPEIVAGVYLKEE